MKNMTWDNMVNRYPGQWVAVENAVMNGPDIVSGDVVAVKTDDDICDYEDEHMKEGLIFRRTTEGRWSSVIDANVAISVS